MEKEMSTVTEIIQRLRDRHYIHDFEVSQGRVVSKETNEDFHPQDLLIERVYRFEGDSNPDDMSVIYGVTAPSGTMGIIMDAYGTYADPAISKVIKQIPVKEITD